MKIIVVRHGYDDFDKQESSIGKQQITDSCSALDFVVADKERVVILHSGIYRTKESAKIASDRLGVDTIEVASWLGEDRGGDVSKELDGYISTHKNLDVLMLFSHLPTIQSLLGSFAQKYDIHCVPDIGYGSIFMIDLDNGAVRQCA